MPEFVDENDNNQRDSLKDTIIEFSKTAFNPKSDPKVRAEALKEFEKAVNNASAWSLLPILNAAIQPGAVPAYCRPPLLDLLTHIPLRPLGIRSTLEFIFAVHPGTQVTAEESAQPQKLGANITTEALDTATKLLSTVPPGDDPTQWFLGIRGELMELLDGLSGRELAKVAGHVISFGILGRKVYGAPGMPGWNVFIAPLLKAIKPTIDAAKIDDKSKIKQEEVLDLSKGKILSKHDEIALAIQRLSALLHSSPSPGLCKRIVPHIILELWAISSAQGVEEGSEVTTKFCKPARKLLSTFITVATSQTAVNLLIDNLLYNGQVDNLSCPWEYRIEKTVEAVACPRNSAVPNLLSIDWDLTSKKAAYLATLVVNSCTDDEISDIFLTLFQKWLQSKNKQSTPKPKIQVLIKEEDEDKRNPEKLVKDLLEIMLLQSIIEKAGQKFISKSSQLLDLVQQILDTDKTEPQEEEVVSVALSLFNQIVTAPNFSTSALVPATLESLKDSLSRLSRAEDRTTSQTARNLSMLLKYRDELDDDEERKPANDKQIEDRKAYTLAMSYITEADSPPPVKSEGLNIISKLLLDNSPILDILALLVLLSKIISDTEDFLNLRAVKMFTLVSERHPKTVCRELLDHYLDPKERTSTDERLRFGEALLQVIQRLGQMFTGEIATEVSETLLSIASRRGYRPKTEKRQAREAKKQQMRNKEAEDAWGGKVLDMSDDIPEEERSNNEILAQIVQGWESKRGSEDIRIRSSALSLFATAMETNFSAIGPTLVEAAVDLCVNVLSFETDIETGILRRSAIVVISTFVKALEVARNEGHKLGFGLTDESRKDIIRTLRYVQVTDNDGLVREHAKDAIESLETWQMIQLMPTAKEESAFGGLAGIVGNPIERAIKTESSGTINGRPRIEEIE